MRLVNRVIGIFFLLLTVLILGQEVKRPPKGDEALPLPEGKIQPVYDYGNLFTPNERASLKQTLINYADSTSTEIVLITVKSLDGAPINQVAAQTGDYWMIGQKDKDNGIVILISVEDRLVTIQTGYGSQVAVTPSMANLVIEEIIQPYFRRAEYFKGTEKALFAIFDFMSGKFEAERKPYNDFPWDTVLLIGLTLLFLFIIIRNNSGGGKRRGPGGMIYTDFGRSPWFGGGGGFGGGGFGGFGGGGGFSGGGASGGW